MANLMKQLNNKFGLRFLHRSQIHGNELKAMKKIMKGSSSKKKYRYVENYALPSPNVFSAGSFESKTSPNSKRANVLNKLFMYHITDIMATGENSSKFMGHGIEISHVQVWPDFKGLNVYWIAKGTEKDEIIEKILCENARALRHELTQLRVVGIVPKITFVKDKHYAKVAEVERILSKVDFGEDYVPSDPLLQLKSELQITSAIDEKIKNKIKELDAELECEEQEIPLPPMPDNVLGLNHGDIMKRVCRGMKKSEAAHRKTGTPVSNLEMKMGECIEIEFVNKKKQNEEFKQFLQKRQIMRAKRVKSERRNSLGPTNMGEHDEDNHLEQLLNLENFKDDTDYIEEEDNEEVRK